MSGSPLDFEFLQERYDAEMVRANRLTDSLGLPLAALTALGSLIAVMGRGFSYRSGVPTIAFQVFLVGDCCVFAASLLMLAFAYYRQDVAFLQTLGDLDKAMKDLAIAHPATGKDEFVEYVRNSMIEATDLNIASNDRRAAYLFRARAFMLLVVVLTGLAGVPYVVDQAKVKQVPVMHIDNFDENRIRGIR